MLSVLGEDEAAMEEVRGYGLDDDEGRTEGRRP